MPALVCQNIANTMGSSTAMFLVDMHSDPSPLASKTSDQMIRFNLFHFLSVKSAVPFLQKKLLKIPFKW